MAPPLPGFVHSRWITSTFGGPLGISCATMAPPPKSMHQPAHSPITFFIVHLSFLVRFFSFSDEFANDHRWHSTEDMHAIQGPGTQK
jgi:hypothetical protein